MDATEHDRRPRTGGSDAPERLIAAAIELFGRKGYEGASTREIARAAAVNIAGIAYHFGGKQGLYEASARHIAGFVRAGLERGLGASIGDLAPKEAAEAVDVLKRILSTMIRLLLVSPETESFARFILREQMDPTPAFDILFTSVMEPVHKRVCLLWQAATGEPAEAEETIAKMLGLIAQVLMFRMARAGAMRRLGWNGIGDHETAVIERTVHGALEGLLRRSGAAR